MNQETIDILKSGDLVCLTNERGWSNDRQTLSMLPMYWNNDAKIWQRKEVSKEVQSGANYIKSTVLQVLKQVSRHDFIMFYDWADVWLFEDGNKIGVTQAGSFAVCLVGEAVYGIREFDFIDCFELVEVVWRS